MPEVNCGAIPWFTASKSMGMDRSCIGRDRACVKLFENAFELVAMVAGGDGNVAVAAAVVKAVESELVTSARDNN